MADAKSKEPSLLRKLTARDIMGDKVPQPTKPTDLYTIYGIASGIKGGESAYGHWEMFTGEFRAVRISDGAEFAAPVAAIPEPAFGMIKAALTQEGNTQGVQFALIIGNKPSPREPDKKYEYTVKPVVKPAENTLLQDLREKSLAALPAPAKR